MPEERLGSSVVWPRTAAPAAHGLPGTDNCGICGHGIQRSYFRLNGVLSCGHCADEAQRGQPRESDAAYARGLALGTGAAVVGMMLYAAFTILTNIQIGYMALAVGWMVGKAIITGSHGIGGRRYQITALLLTYAAVSVAAVPIAVGMAAKEHHAIRAQVDQSRMAEDEDGAAAGSAPNLAVTLLGALGYGLIAPLMSLRYPVDGMLGLLHGVMGVAILAVGLREAWRGTRPREVKVEGPFKAVTFRV